MQMQDVVASGTFQQVVDVLGGVSPRSFRQGEVAFVWFGIWKCYSAFPVPISYGLRVVLEPLWGCVFFYVNLIPQPVLCSEGRDSALNTEARTTEHHWCLGILAPILCGFHQFMWDLAHSGVIS